MTNFISKKIYFPVNMVLFNLCRLWPLRNKKLWIFGAIRGVKYDDNSRALFEYIKKEKKHDGIRVVWMTNSSDVLYTLKEKGYEVYKNNTFYGMWIQLKAGCAFYTNSLSDFGFFPLIGGATIVCLWHGVGFKKCYNARLNQKILLIKRPLDHIFSWTYRSITTATSQWTVEWFESMFTLDKKRVYITGQPRNDVLKRVSRSDVLKKMGLSVDKKIILYTPTYRLKTYGEQTVENIVETLYRNRELNIALDEIGGVFLVKPHPLTPKINLKSRENFRILTYSDVENNQELLGACDMLITDYSSTFVDFSLLNRPIIFYTPDMEEFLLHSEELFDVYFKIQSKNAATNPETLADKIRNPSTDVSKVTNEIYEDESIAGTCYSENVYNVVGKEIKLI